MCNPPPAGTYDVLLRRNADGVERRCRVEWDWFKHGPGGDLYWWTEGSFSCDCNRELAFLDAAGETRNAEPACARTRYTAIRAILPDSREITLDRAPGTVTVTRMPC